METVQKLSIFLEDHGCGCSQSAAQLPEMARRSCILCSFILMFSLTCWLLCFLAVDNQGSTVIKMAWNFEGQM